MKNLTLLLLILFSCNFLIGQDVAHISGRINMTANPCVDSICPPGLVWSLATETTSFILTKSHNWIWSSDSLIINGKKYIENDSISFFGDKKTKEAWNGDKFYELEILDINQKDTIIDKDDTLTVKFNFHIWECGISVYRHPFNYSISQTENIWGTTSGYSTYYTYKSTRDFIGVDTVLFLTGCGSERDNMSFSIIEYLIHVSDDTTNINLTNDSNLRIFPNPSTGLITIKNNNHQELDYCVYNSNGQTVKQGKLKRDLQLYLNRGIYFVNILDKTKLVYRQKVIIG
jgi:hypothetical protein